MASECDSVNNQTVDSRHKIFVDCLYKLYSLSPKNERELSKIAADTNVHLLKIGKTFEVRWAFSTFQALKALLKDNGERSVKEASKCRGLASKMSNWMFVSQLCMLKDALRTLKHLSLFFQSIAANIMVANERIQQSKASLTAMKSLPGKSLQKMWADFDLGGSYKGVKLTKTNADSDNFDSTKNNFFNLCWII